MSPPATSTAAVCESSKVRCSAGSRVATITAAATPRYIATPPPRGVGMTCTSRSRGAAIIRSRTAAIRTTGVARKVTSPAVSRTTAYSRTVQSWCGPRGVPAGRAAGRLIATVLPEARRQGGRGWRYPPRYPAVLRGSGTWTTPSVGRLGDDLAQPLDGDGAHAQHPGHRARAVDDRAGRRARPRAAVEDDRGVLAELRRRLL